MSCTAPSRRDDSDTAPMQTIIYPEIAAAAEIVSAVVDPSGRVLKSIKGHVYCGDGLTQKPANRAQIDLVEKNKILVSATSNMDGSYEMIYKKGFRSDYQITISSKCGNTQTSLPIELVKNQTDIDFWIK